MTDPEITGLTPEWLRAVAKSHSPHWDGQARQALQWQDMQIEKLRGLLARVIAEDDSNVDTATCLSYELTDEIRVALQVGIQSDNRR